MTTHTISAGLGLKPQHFDAALACGQAGLWFEVHPENYLMDGGPRLAWLQAIRERHPLALHGVSLSLAGPDAPDPDHLRRLAHLIDRVEPVLVSEHLAWSRIAGHYLPDLLPVPRTSTTLARVAANINRTQDALKRRIALENPSHYLHMEQHAWSEPEFLQELVRRTGCALLIDVNNVHVSACNLGIDARAYLDQLPAADIHEIHLAGHSADASLPGLLVDSHDAPVAPVVWALYQHLITRIGPRPTLIERDGNVPAFEQLLQERTMAADLLADVAQADQEQAA
ncbi:DUF692 domain-containing protein [Herbaspirillum frisingense]|uniref:MNIO family bufferin maturase n=1 Tax=Herbaspirillum frisingense TaxID=92645 RepID=UPI0015FF3507|nr:DUF692 domain-containing protein [Herbaspirillum frisingense]QNB08406.1 DUF692 domain-containing protein [Herbaspirillum frisingense]